ncbi:hypothetical protein B0H14DRAFT_3491665 [Mycena olivaceomarginata]|nr:hypothetical protein B0H14DRAFT_3523505 [Mycena olivaceomarginata]KAJ7799362.1 hypothetical protein B0H14DRAFT_3491665 [Mycena olivaceomarginata]
MPIMHGASLPSAQIDQIFLDVNRLLDQEHWQHRGRSECTCGQTASFACSDCTVPDLCKVCMVAAHQGLPFHSIREWSVRANYYIPATLHQIGLRVGFGHGGGTCPKPRPARLEAITVCGIKTVTVDFCTCRGAYDDDGQIKAHGWWPMRGNFVSALTREMLVVLVPRQPDAGDSSEAEESGSDGESAHSTESSTSE